jgi:hypothetical protein
MAFIAAPFVVGAIGAGVVAAAKTWEFISELDFRPVVIWNRTSSPVVVRFYYDQGNYTSNTWDSAPTVSYRVLGAMNQFPSGTPVKQRIEQLMSKNKDSKTPLAVPESANAGFEIPANSRIVLIAPPFRSFMSRKLITSKQTGSAESIAKLFPAKGYKDSGFPTRAHAVYDIPTFGVVGVFIDEAHFQPESMPSPSSPTPKEMSAIGSGLATGVQVVATLVRVVARSGGRGKVKQATYKNPNVFVRRSGGGYEAGVIIQDRKTRDRLLSSIPKKSRRSCTIVRLGGGSFRCIFSSLSLSKLQSS